MSYVLTFIGGAIFGIVGFICFFAWGMHNNFMQKGNGK